MTSLFLEDAALAEGIQRLVDKHLYDRVVYGSGDDAVLSDLFALETIYSQRAEERPAVIGLTPDLLTLLRMPALRAELLR